MGPNGFKPLLKILAGSSPSHQGDRDHRQGTHPRSVATKAIVSYLPDADFLNWTAIDAIASTPFFSDFRRRQKPPR